MSVDFSVGLMVWGVCYLGLDYDWVCFLNVGYGVWLVCVVVCRILV